MGLEFLCHLMFDERIERIFIYDNIKGLIYHISEYQTFSEVFCLIYKLTGNGIEFVKMERKTFNYLPDTTVSHMMIPDNIEDKNIHTRNVALSICEKILMLRIIDNLGI